MKRIIALILLLCAPALSAHQSKTDDLQLMLTLTRGERSKDSHSKVKTVRIKGDELAYDVTYRGGRARKTEPVHKVFKITEDERKSLLAIIEQKNLLTSESKEFPRKQGYTYFDITLRLNVKGKESRIKLSGEKYDNPDLEQDLLFQNTEALVTEIFNILKRKDASIVYQGMM